MRIILNISKNKEAVPFNYQSKLVGTLHKWLGKNELHDQLSLYSFSWLMNGKQVKNGLTFSNGTTWFINSYEKDLLKELVFNIQKDNNIAFGMRVHSISIQEDPSFTNEHIFKVASPVFIKKHIEGKSKFFFYNDEESSILLTNTLKNKLRKAGKDEEGVSVAFLKDYHNPSTKIINYKGIENKGSICPIVVKGTPEQIAFAWNVGVGNSTGIGFGSLY